MPVRLENYVEELRHELKDLPVTQRAEQLAEVRTHLNALIEANRELGLTEEEAEAAAIAQLGVPRQTTRTERRTFWGAWSQGPFFAAHVFLTIGCLIFMLGMAGMQRPSTPQSMLTHIPFILPLFLLGWLMSLKVGESLALLAIPMAAMPPLTVMYGFMLLIANQTSASAGWFWPLASVGLVAAPVFAGVLLSFRLPSRRRKLA
ncbi:MAG: permease prefix domain 1-containing protein [Armatimonas sp.]